MFNKLKGKMSIEDVIEIKLEHEKKWEAYFESKIKK
jgi:hypothetical protein